MSLYFRTINESLHTIDRILDSSQVRVLLTDAAAYMLKCGQSLKVFFPRLLHITCVGHGLFLVCEKAQETFPDVNQLITLEADLAFIKAHLCSLPKAIEQPEEASLPLVKALDIMDKTKAKEGRADCSKRRWSKSWQRTACSRHSKR